MKAEFGNSAYQCTSLETRSTSRQPLPTRHIVAFFGLLALSAQAQLPQPHLTSLSRCGGQAGESIETKIAGTELEEATLRFTHPGITATADAKDAKKLTIAIGKDVPPGFYDVRVVGKYGVSNPRVFQVGSLPEIVENDKHGTRETAQEIAVPSIVNGAAGSQAEDWYKVMAKKGQKLSFRCWAAELDSKMVPVLALFDDKGHELRRERHQHTLDWQATEDGYDQGDPVGYGSTEQEAIDDLIDQLD